MHIDSNAGKMLFNDFVTSRGFLDLELGIEAADQSKKKTPD